MHGLARRHKGRYIEITATAPGHRAGYGDRENDNGSDEYPYHGTWQKTLRLRELTAGGESGSPASATNDLALIQLGSAAVSYFFFFFCNHHGMVAPGAVSNRGT